MSEYADAIERLDTDGALYPPFCTRAEIRHAASAPHWAHADGSCPGTGRIVDMRMNARSVTS